MITLWVITLALAVAVVVLAFSLFQERQAHYADNVRADEREMDLMREVKDAYNRLFAASESGKVIPPSDLPFVDPVAETPLAPELLEFLQQYDDVAVRGKYERMMRVGLAKQMSPLAILKTFESTSGLLP